MDLHYAAQLGQEGHWPARLEIRVQILLQCRWLNHGCKVRQDTRSVADFRQHVHLEVRREWIRQPHVPREGRQYKVPHLNAIRRDDIAEAVVVVAQEFGEVVKQNEQHAQGPFVEHRDGLGQLGVSQEWRQKFEQVNQQLGVHPPAFLLRSD